jgi:hypothetical protein
MKIIVADDEPANRKLASIMLQRLGHEVRTVNDGAELLKELSVFRADLVFLDIHMPVLGGIETAREIVRRWKDVQRPAMIALTASASDEELRDCEQVGICDVLLKPVRLAALQHAVNELASRRAPSSADPPVPSSVDPSAWESQLKRRLEEFDILDSPRDAADLLEQFLLSADRLLAELHDASAVGDPHLVFQKAHALKGMSANLGLVGFAVECAELESEARTTSPERLQPMLDRLQVMYDRGRDVIIRLRSSFLSAKSTAPPSGF